jgi:signal transduction histidine kinase
MTVPSLPSDLAYFGAAMASISHELKNVVTIINEAAGLLGDLTLAAERGRPLEPARLRRISEEIGRNVQRGVDVINRMNRLAHAADEPARGVDLELLVVDTLAVAGRYPGLRDLVLEHPPTATITVRTDPFRLHRALVIALRLMIQAGGSAPVRVELAAMAGGGAAIRVARSPLPADEEVARALEALHASLVELGGRGELAPDRGAVILGLPARSD